MTLAITSDELILIYISWILSKLTPVSRWWASSLALNHVIPQSCSYQNVYLWTANTKTETWYRFYIACRLIFVSNISCLLSLHEWPQINYSSPPAVERTTYYFSITSNLPGPNVPYFSYRTTRLQPPRATMAGYRWRTQLNRPWSQA